MNNKQKLLAFFDAENKRDWATYRAFLHPQITWLLHSKEEKLISGIDAYLKTITDAYAGSGEAFAVESLYESGDENRIVAILVNSRGGRSCDIFDFKGGLISAEHEFILS